MAESASPQICPVFVVCRSYQDGNSDKLLLLKIDLVSPSRRDSLVPALQVRGGESHGEIHLDAFEIWFSKEKVGVGIEGRWLRSIQCLSDKREDPDSFSRTSVKSVAWWYVPEIPVLGKRQVNPWGLLVSQPAEPIW